MLRGRVFRPGGLLGHGDAGPGSVTGEDTGADAMRNVPKTGQPGKEQGWRLRECGVWAERPWRYRKAGGGRLAEFEIGIHLSRTSSETEVLKESIPGRQQFYFILHFPRARQCSKWKVTEKQGAIPAPAALSCVPRAET